jgi:predicted nucleotidyltransferase
MNSNFIDLLSLFNRHRVRYLVAGGYAVMYYTSPRYTKDLDVVIGLTDEDTGKAADALREFGFPITDAQLAELRTPNKMIVLGRAPHRIDVLNGIDGIDFDEAYERRQAVVISGETCWFLSLEDLIAAKKAAGRPQDKLDLKGLQKELKLRKQ